MSLNSLTGKPVRHPVWSLTYQGKKITGDISNAVLDISFVDVVTGAMGEVQISLQDREKKWQGPWYPTQGDLLNLQIGYAGEDQLNCGEFMVDELELEGPPDVFKIRAIPVYITTALRTRNTLGYEGQTLLQIATTIAAKHNLTVVGLPNDVNVRYLRVTQKRETDLSFLKRLAEDNNYAFTIRHNPTVSPPDQLIFYSVLALEQNAVSFTVPRQVCEKFEFKGKAFQIYAGSQVSYQDPITKQLITATVPAAVDSPTGDTLKVVSRVENPAQALSKAQGLLHDNNQLFTTGNLTLPGDIRLRGGLNIAVTGFGAYDGTFFIMKGTHKLDRDSGYSTEVELRRIPS